MLSVYKAAFEQMPPTVLRRGLLPFTLGHAFLLDAGENSFALDSGKPPELNDLYPAVHLCTLDFRAGIRFLAGTVDASEWAESCKELDLVQEAVTFRNYMAGSLTIPKRKQAGPSHKCRVPWQLQIAAGLCDGGPLSVAAFDTAMNTPLSEAFIFLAARQAFQGDETLIGEEESKILDFVKAQPDFEPVKAAQ